MRKQGQWIHPDLLKKLLSIARGETRASLLIQNVTLLDLINGGTQTTHVAIHEGYIAGVGNDYAGDHILDGQGLTIIPGFIDAHVHLESSFIHPFEFEALTLPLGTTTAICDPHEITNVMGESGLAWFLRCAELMHQNLFVQVPSCIPSLPGFETTGKLFPLEAMKSYRDHPHVLGLAEMMNFPGVIAGDPNVIEKLTAFENMMLDGHAPALQGKSLNAYRLTGIENCHETCSLEEGKEKLTLGMSLMLREGSVAKNLSTLAPLLNDFNSIQCMLCTDDRNPLEIHTRGHLNEMVRRLIQDHQMAPHVAYRLSSYSPAKHFGLKRFGLIAPGYKADFILLNNPQTVDIHSVYIGGVPITQLNLSAQKQQKLTQSQVPDQNTIQRNPVTRKDFESTFEEGSYHVIQLIPNQVMTKHKQVAYSHGNFLEKDVLPLFVIERHGHQLKPARGLVQGFELFQGAIASSVAHDCHPLIAVGDQVDDLCLALNTLIQSGGGFVVVQNNQVLAHLPLPLAGLMSTESSETLYAKLIEIKKATAQLKIRLSEPFLQLAFLALPVIPELKLTDQGLIQVNPLRKIPLKVENL